MRSCNLRGYVTRLRVEGARNDSNPATVLNQRCLLAAAVFFTAVTLRAQNSPSAPAQSPLPRPPIARHSINIASAVIAVPTPLAGLHLDTLDTANFETNGATWEKLARKLRNREMPPAGMPRPDDGHLRRARQVYRDRARSPGAEAKPNPGRPTLHRLNRTEYGNAVRDLLALEIDVAELLPADDIGYGFDNIGDVLQVSPVLMERYLSAARRISRTAVGDTTIPVAYQTYNVHHGLIQTDRLRRSRAGRLARRLHRAPPVPGGRRIRDFGHPAKECGRRISGPRAGTQARSQAR